MTRALKIKYPNRWSDFCHSRWKIALLMVSPWILGFILSFMIRVIAPGMEFGYNCLMGFCFFIPTGEKSNFDTRWLNIPPNALVFIVPYGVIIASYIVIWKHIRDIKSRSRDMLNVNIGNGDQLKDTEIRFIWTIFIVCICYLISSVPITINRFNMESTQVTDSIIILSLVMCQYTINIFIYTYRSVQYRKAYLDLLVLIFPCLGRFQSVQYQLTPSDLKPSSKATSQTGKNEVK